MRACVYAGVVACLHKLIVSQELETAHGKLQCSVERAARADMLALRAHRVPGEPPRRWRMESGFVVFHCSISGQSTALCHSRTLARADSVQVLHLRSNPLADSDAKLKEIARLNVEIESLNRKLAKGTQ